MRETWRRVGTRAAKYLLFAACLGAAGITHALTFSGVVLKDQASLGADELFQAYTGYVGKPLDRNLKKRLLRGLQRHYTSLGFLPPAPRVHKVHRAAGLLVVEMRESHVARVRVQGEAHIEDEYFWNLVERLKQIRPLSQARFDGWLAEVASLGITAEGNLIRASEDSHRYIANVSVLRKRWEGLVSVHNRAPKQLQNTLLQFSLGFSAPSPTLGSLRFDAATVRETERLRYMAFSGEHELAGPANSVHWRYALSDSTLPLGSDNIDVAFERRRAEIGWRHRRAHYARTRSAYTLSLRSYDLEQSWAGGVLRTDSIRAVRLGYELARARASRHLHQLHVNLEQSISTEFEPLGASNEADRDFTVAEIRYAYRYRFNDNWRGNAMAHLQLSSNQLPSSERFFVGGSRLGGAFDPATLSGDQGLGLRLTLERLFFASSLDEPARVFAYYDHGMTRANDPAGTSDDAGSLGLGLEIAYHGLNLGLELAHPIIEPAARGVLQNDSRVFFSISQRF